MFISDLHTFQTQEDLLLQLEDGAYLRSTRAPGVPVYTRQDPTKLWLITCRETYNFTEPSLEIKQI